MKPSVPVAAVTEFLDSLVALRPESVEGLNEGQESQAFRFDDGHDAFVLRIGSSRRGFEKDRWAQMTVGERVPVPRVAALGQFDQDNVYCITEWTPGVTLEDLAPADVETVVDEVRKVWCEIARSAVDSIEGFGDFDPDGTAPAVSWQEVLHATLEEGTADLVDGGHSAGLQDFRRVFDTYRELIVRCPEERALIHCDFGSNNVLTHEGRITAVLDWDCAMVGDPLYDVATSRFWATHLSCMRVQAEHFDRILPALPSYKDRVLCYALRIGIEEARESFEVGDREMAKWVMDRCLELLRPQPALP